MGTRFMLLRAGKGEEDFVVISVNGISHKIRRGVEYVVREKGEWVPSESDFDDDDTLFDVEEWCDWQCSVCHGDICYEDPMERRWLPKFCPNCGADMRKGENAE